MANSFFLKQSHPTKRANYITLEVFYSPSELTRKDIKRPLRVHQKTIKRTLNGHIAAGGSSTHSS